MNRNCWLVALSASLGFALAFTVSTPTLAGNPKAPQQVAVKVKPADLTGTWNIDKAHTEIGFAVTHLGVSKTRGRFTDFDGAIKVDGTKPENSSVEVKIKTASVNTGNDTRDNHLKSKDFFDSESFPEMTFKSSQVKKGKNGSYTALGMLTIKGVSKPVSLTFTPSTPQKGPRGEWHTGLSSITTINRKDYGLIWNGLIEGTQAVGDSVEITIDLEAVKA
jgi:polyisoprenoid-binding protein YceI